MRKLIPNSTQVPDVIIDVWMALLSGAEFKVILYIARRTYGFGKEGDNISLKQLVQGIVTRDGRRLDSGTGLNKDTVSKALGTLEEKGLIVRTRRDSDEYGHLANYYRLNLDAEGFGEGDPVEPEDGGPGPLSENPTSSPEEIVTPLTGNSDKPSGEIRQAPVGKSVDPLSENPTYKKQQSQETEEQETATTATAAVISPSAFSEKGEMEESVRLLIQAGFSHKDAEHLAQRHSAQNISDQVKWISKRTVTKNRLGMLRKAIEQSWPKPISPEEEQRKASEERSRKIEETKKQEREVWAAKLQEVYQRLPDEVPEAYDGLTAFIDAERVRVAERKIVRDHPRLLKVMQDAFDTKPKRIEMMVTYFRDRQEIPVEMAQAIRQVPSERLEEVLKTIESEHRAQAV